jgi:hypothetical protein
LFDPGEAACLQARLKDFPQGKGEAVAILSDAFGQEVWKQTFSLEGKADLAVDMGKPGRGYYELKIAAKVQQQDGTTVEGSGKASLGIMESVKRSAAEVREKGYRFGVKWWGGVQDKKETLEMMANEAVQRGWQGRALAHHCRAMALYPEPVMRELFGLEQTGLEAAEGAGPMTAARAGCRRTGRRPNRRR